MSLSLDRYLRERLPMEAELDLLFSNDARLVIFDVGACEGEDSIRYQRRFPQASLYAFEPLPGNAAKARQHFEEYGTTAITLEQIALGREDGEAELHVSSGQPPGHEADEWDYGNKSSSFLPPEETLVRHPWLKFDRTITVPVTTLANYAAAHRIEHVDLLHLDVQGAELLVLAGARSLLENVKVVWMEVEAVPLYRGQPLRSDVESFMRARGFVKVRDTVDDVSGDHLYIRPAFFGRRQTARLRLRHLLRTRAARILPVVRWLTSGTSS